MRGTRVLIGLTVLAITLAGCAAAGSTPSTPDPSASPSAWPSGDNGISSLPANQIARLAAQALETADSVHLTGFVQDEGEQRFDVDVIARGTTDGAGTATVDGNTVTVIRVDGYNYAKADRRFWATYDVGRNHDAQVGTAADGKYVRASLTSADLAALAKFIDMPRALVDQLVAMPAVTRGPRLTINGVPTIAITGPDLGTFYIATQGPPDVIRAIGPGGAATGIENLTIPATKANITAPRADDTIDFATATGS
jgi:hypothetical protein